MGNSRSTWIQRLFSCYESWVVARLVITLSSNFVLTRWLDLVTQLRKISYISFTRLVSRRLCVLSVVLDEYDTRVVLNHGDENIQEHHLIPKQFQTLMVDFEGAANSSPALHVVLAANPTSPFWEFDEKSGPCNVIATISIPVPVSDSNYSINFWTLLWSFCELHFPPWKPIDDLMTSGIWISWCFVIRWPGRCSRAVTRSSSIIQRLPRSSAWLSSIFTAPLHASTNLARVTVRFS